MVACNIFSCTLLIFCIYLSQPIITLICNYLLQPIMFNCYRVFLFAVMAFVTYVLLVGVVLGMQDR